MNKIIKTIQSQVSSCKKLLKVFQDERQVYNTKNSVGIKEVKTILARKKLIVSAFEGQHAVLKEMKNSSSSESPLEVKAQKETLRELGSILEQLLVIDHENEKLLRKMLSVQPSQTTRTRSLAPVGNARPALQRQLPFVPGGTFQSSNTAARPMVSAPTPRALNRLKQYGTSLQRQKLESKYA